MNDSRECVEDSAIQLTELIAAAPWREAVTYRDTWPHQYVLMQKDGPREMLDVVCRRLRDGEGVPCRFFAMLTPICSVHRRVQVLGAAAYGQNGLERSGGNQPRPPVS